MDIPDIREALHAIRRACDVVPVTVETHDLGLELAERHVLSIYDAMIVASALLAGCATLLSEDLQPNQLFERRLRVRNPLA